MKSRTQNSDPAALLPTAPSPDDATRTGESLGALPPPPGSRDRIPFAAGDMRDPQRYQVLGEHGRGGLGRVSRVHDRDLGRDIAIKELISRGNVSELRFLREALITARLEHPGVVPVYEAGRWPDGTPFYAMKLVSGRSLRALIAERTKVEDRLALLHHVIAVADAIAYAHDHSIIHRDLKPANVIVGDFGETIVIDWGLAKDLSSTGDEVGLGGGPFRVRGDDGLTSTGSVLGTPAYMAPEQARGEPVDQRADVYAIGIMLWELCSSSKLPRGFAEERRSLLRRAGIDPDLGTIIDKAVDPEPARRYRDAGGLAADLKAFKTGARIAARQYSLLAVLAHWTRRHRVTAASVAIVVALAALGVAIDVQRIAAERDRVTAANAALVLEKADLLLRTDPTAALAALDDYAGPETSRLELLRAQALGLGVARLRAAPHAQIAGFVQPIGDGTLLTVGDGHVTKTSLDGRSRSIADIDPWKYVSDYAAARGVLAFSCPATKICLLDSRTERLLPSPAAVAMSPTHLALSPSAHLLAAMSDRGELALWQLSGTGSPILQIQAQVDRGRSLMFAGDDLLAVQSGEGIRLFHLDALGRLEAAPDDVSIPEISDLSAMVELHRFALGDTTGQLTLVDGASAQVVQRVSICKGAVNKLIAVPSRRSIAYTCQDGDVGTWHIADNAAAVHAHLDGGASVLAASADGRYLLAGGNAGRLIVHDFSTAFTKNYLGHTSRVLAVSSPTSAFPYIASVDSHGELRVWDLPDSAVVTAIALPTRLFQSDRLESDGTLIAIGNSTLVSWRRVDGTSGQTDGHDPAHARLAVSSTQPEAVIYGTDDELELWTFDGKPARRTLRTGHGQPRAVAYRYRDAAFIVASSDGTLVEWSNAGTGSRLLGSIDEPIAFIRRVPNSDSVIVGASSGRLWMFGPNGKTHLGWEPNPTSSVVVSPDAQWLAIASPQGVVHLYNLATLAVLTLRSPDDSNEWLWFSADSTQLGVVTSKTISLVTMPSERSKRSTDDGRRWSWNELDLAARHLYFSPDNEWLAATGDHGSLWFNRRGDRRWIYLPVGANRIIAGNFSSDGGHFLANDAGGRVLSIDMRASLFALK